MSTLQLMIDEFESKSAHLEGEIAVLNVEIQQLSDQLKSLAKNSELKQEQHQQYIYAVARLRAIEELEAGIHPETGEPSQDATIDPWGDAS